MKRSTLLLVAASAVIVVGGTALSTVASADRGWGPGYGSGPCMGPGQGRGYDDDDDRGGRLTLRALGPEPAGRAVEPRAEFGARRGGGR